MKRSLPCHSRGGWSSSIQEMWCVGQAWAALEGAPLKGAPLLHMAPPTVGQDLELGTLACSTRSSQEPGSCPACHSIRFKRAFKFLLVLGIIWKVSF